MVALVRPGPGSYELMICQLFTFSWGLIEEGSLGYFKTGGFASPVLIPSADFGLSLNKKLPGFACRACCFFISEHQTYLQQTARHEEVVFLFP